MVNRKSTQKQEYTPVAINARIETEKVLGPLPPDWESTPWGPKNRVLFVDHKNRSTSWVDPRTYAIRKHDITQVVPGELPYGWEEAFDKMCGIYYVDHLSRMNFLEGPWDKQVQQKVLDYKEKAIAEAKALQEKIHRKKKEMAHSKHQEVVQKEIDEFQARLKELQLLNDHLETDNQALVKHTQEANYQIEELRHLIEVESKKRETLTDYIRKLKLDVIGICDPEALKKAKEQEALAKKQSPTDTTELPHDLDLKELKARLEEEKEERRRLKELTETLEAEKSRLRDELVDQEASDKANRQHIPEWIKDLDVNALKSKTLRKKLASENPDNLKFKDKILKYTAAAMDSDEKPKMPEQPSNPKPVAPAKGKETAFADAKDTTATTLKRPDPSTSKDPAKRK